MWFGSIKAKYSGDSSGNGEVGMVAMNMNMNMMREEEIITNREQTATNTMDILHKLQGMQGKELPNVNVVRLMNGLLSFSYSLVTSIHAYRRELLHYDSRYHDSPTQRRDRRKLRQDPTSYHRVDLGCHA